MALLWSRIVKIGVDETISPFEIRYITLVNILAIFIFVFELLNILMYIPYTSILPQKFILTLVTIVAFLNLGVVLLNYYKRYLLARISFGLLAIIYISVISFYLGHESLMPVYLLESVVIAFFIFPPQQRVYRNIIVFLFAISFIALEIQFVNEIEAIKVIQKLINYGVIIGLVLLIIATSSYNYTIVTSAEALLEAEQKKSERLLLNILPRSIVKRLKDGASHIADNIDNATILFSDIVNFTDRVKIMSAEGLVVMLDEMFTEFDLLADKYGVEKIKTIGDSYMVAGGIPEPRIEHCQAIADMALNMREVMHHKLSIKYPGLTLRIGIHTGAVVAGVIGQRKFSYDLWGNSVNIASRMESYSIADKIQVTAQVYEKLKDTYDFIYHDDIVVIGKEPISTYFLLNKKIVPV